MRPAMFAAVVFFLSLAGALWAGEPPRGDLYVAPNGNDAWSGRFHSPTPDGSDGPLATLAGARDAVRKLKRQQSKPKAITVLVSSGVYRVTEPVVFTPEDSGTANAPITYKPYNVDHVTLSGGVPIRGWKVGQLQDKRTEVENSSPSPRPSPGGRGGVTVWTTTIPAVKEGRWYFRELFVGGRRATPARIPQEGWHIVAGPAEPMKRTQDDRRNPKLKVAFKYSGDGIRPLANQDDAVAVVYHCWTTSRHYIESIDPEKKIIRFTNPSCWPMGWWGKDERYYIEFVREGLTAPGRWYLDRKSGELSYCPLPGQDPAKTEVVAPMPEEIIRLEGDPAAGKWVEHLQFRGLTFAETAWHMPATKNELFDSQAAAFLRTATVFARGARHCAFENCTIARTGGYGLWLAGGCQDNRVRDCDLFDLGAGGVRIGETKLPREESQQTLRNEIANCVIHSGGKVFHAGIGVWIGKSSCNTVRNNEICDFLYTGVSVGWTWGYAPSEAHHNVIDSNHIHHLGYGQLSDMGGIYTLGISPGTRLTHNRIHDVLAYSYGGWGLYTDEGSSGILLENNIVYRVKDGSFHQHYGKENVVRNNILAFSATKGQIQRSRQEPHRSFTLERNIVYYNYPPLLGKSWSDGHYLLDYNCYWDTSGRPPVFPINLSLAQWRAKGQDVHTIVADPKFVDAANFDFRLAEDSPARKLGFRPIDVKTIGPQGSAARRPSFQPPPLKLPGDP